MTSAWTFLPLTFSSCCSSLWCLGWENLDFVHVRRMLIIGWSTSFYFCSLFSLVVSFFFVPFLDFSHSFVSLSATFEPLVPFLLLIFVFASVESLCWGKIRPPVYLIWVGGLGSMDLELAKPKFSW